MCIGGMRRSSVFLLLADRVRRLLAISVRSTHLYRVLLLLLVFGKPGTFGTLLLLLLLLLVLLLLWLVLPVDCAV